MRFQVNHEAREITSDDVLRATFRGEPDPVITGTHYVVIRRRQWPAKQVIRRVLDAKGSEVQTKQAVAILRRLGFTTGQQD